LNGSAPEIQAFVARRVRNQADADDLAQQTLLNAYAKLTTFAGGNFRAWLFTIARHLIIDYHRAQNRFQFVDVTSEVLAENEPALQTPPEAVQVCCECRESVRGWVQCLTQRLQVEEQVAVILADAHGYRDRESAEILGMSLASFKLLLHGARARLHDGAGGHCPMVPKTNLEAQAGLSATPGADQTARTSATGSELPKSCRGKPIQKGLNVQKAKCGSLSDTFRHTRPLGVKCRLGLEHISALRSALLRTIRRFYATAVALWHELCSGELVFDLLTIV